MIILTFYEWARPQARGQNISMIEDLSWQRPIAPIQLCGSMDGLTFEAYIIRRVVPQLWPGACLVLDNSSIHQGTEVEAAVRDAGASPIYLSPYSPDFSPIENFWSKVKTIWEQADRGTSKLKSLCSIKYRHRLQKKISHIYHI
ncbi:transposase [Microcystis aeruginosa]